MAHDMGLGSCFSGFTKMIKKDSPVLKGLIKESQTVYCPIIFGYPKSVPKPKVREAKVQTWLKSG